MVFSTIMLAAAAPAGFDLPRPNGPYPVGTRSMVLVDAQRHRDIPLTIWYPSTAGKSAPAPYMDAKTAAALAAEWELTSGFERQVRTHATVKAPIAEGGPFPIVLLEHGSSLAADQDGRIVAGVNIDGSTFPGMNGDVRPVVVDKPYLFLMTEEHARDPGTHGREFTGMPSNSYYVAVAGADHMSFTDTHLIDSRFSRKTRPDDGAFAQALLTTELTRSLVEEFLGKYLKGESAPYLDLGARVDKK